MTWAAAEVSGEEGGEREAQEVEEEEEGEGEKKDSVFRVLLCVSVFPYSEVE